MEVGIRTGDASPDNRLHIFLKIDDEEQYRSFQLLDEEHREELIELQAVYEDDKATPEERANASLKILGILMVGIIRMNEDTHKNVVEIIKPKG